MESFRNKSNQNILADSDLSFIYDDDKLIEDAITTPYEKVLKILTNIKNFIEGLKDKLTKDIRLDINQKEMVKDLEWVINRIQSHSLYTYELIGENEDLEKMSEENPEIKSFLQFLSDYSEGKGFKRGEKKVCSQTTKIKDRPNLPNGKRGSIINNTECNTTTNKGRDFLASIKEGNVFKIQINKVEEMKEESKKKENSSNIIFYPSPRHEDDNFSDLLNVKIEKNKQINEVVVPSKTKKDASLLEGIVKMKKTSNKQLKPYVINVVQPEKKKIDSSLNLINTDENKLPIKFVTDQSNSDTKGMKLNLTSISNLKIEDRNVGFKNNSLKFSDISTVSSQLPQDFEVDVKAIMSKEFNIHDFDKNVGRANVLPLIGKTILNTLGLSEILNTDKLDNFLRKTASGYIESVQYHNSVHAADVAQTISTMFLNSNLEVITLLSQNDILSMIIAALGHDIGHPGTNNGFQINTYSDIAITYNDQSVLENYHTSILFKIIKQEEYNIFGKFPDSTYKTIRKRIINLILSTDMSQHSKVLSILKPKVLDYKETMNKLKQDNSNNSTPVPFITQSNLLFDDQQRVMDFVIHTADLSHNSKKFEISAKWTDLLMEEFWQQGDTEKNLGVPVSFLCDRNTAEVPKSQIGFIRGIVLPTFEVLIELLPTLDYLRDEIENNLNEWGKIVEEQNMNTPKVAKSPRLLIAKSPRLISRTPRNAGTNTSTVKSSFGQAALLGANLNQINNNKMGIFRNEVSVSIDSKPLLNSKK